MNQQITLDQAVEIIENWRAAKTSKQGRIPDDVWEVAIQLTQRHPVSIVAKKMNIKISALQDKIADLKKPLISDESFIEIPQVIPSVQKCILELELSSGAVVRVFQ